MVDRLSDLPELLLVHILSFLPIQLAAQTSLLSRRFRGLWEVSPVLHLNIHAFRCSSDFADVANRTILHRNPLSALHRLSLDLSYPWFDMTLLTASYISSLLLKASSFSLRHLTVELVPERLATLLPLIFSLSFLESLSILKFYCPREDMFPILLTRLKSLSLHIKHLDNDILDRITSHLNALEDLHLKYMRSVDEFDLKSSTIRRLKLQFSVGCPAFKIVIPSLEFFELCSFYVNGFHLEMPLLKKAIIRLKSVINDNVPVTCEMLKDLAHVVGLHLDIQEREDVKYPFHALLVPGVELPTFFKLKHFNLEVCFHEYNIEDLVTLLDHFSHFPALESVKLVHKPPLCHRLDKMKKKKLWRSKLPCNAEGNYRHANFKDLNIDEKRKELIRLLTRKISKKRKA